MINSTIDMIVYYVLFTLVFVPWVFVIGGAIWCYIANKANNNQNMKRAMRMIVISLSIIYIIRFTSLSSFSLLYNKDNVGQINVVQFRDAFTVIQLLLLAFLPSFANTQSSIFNYQKMFTEGKKRESAANQRNSLFAGTIITIIGIIILEIFKRLFVY